MEYKNKLHFYRPNWYAIAISPMYRENYLLWLESNRKYKKFSDNRRAYYFLLKFEGRSFIKKVRSNPQMCIDYMSWFEKAIKTPWIKKDF